MAEKKNSKKLKDINKDGKVNFGDTWLGDALGFDGKVGIQKGRPGLKESLKGARRGSASKSEDKPKDTPKRSTSRSTPSKKKVDIEKLAGDALDRLDGGKPSTRPKARPDRSPARGVPAPSKVEVTPLDSPSKPATKITYEEWKKLSKTERKKRGLPMTTVQWQNQGKFGIPEVKAGMAKGGMAKSKEGRYQQNGGRDLRKTGMFYKSSSPKGYK